MKKILLLLLALLIILFSYGCKQDTTEAEIRGLNDYIYQLEQQIDELERQVESLDQSRNWLLDYTRDLQEQITEGN